MAGRGVALVGVLGVHAQVCDLAVASPARVVHGRHTGDHLVDGAGGVGGQEGVVIEGIAVGLGELVEVLAVAGGVVGGVGGGEQHLAGLHVHGHHGAGVGVLALLLGADAVFLEVFDHLCQGVFGGHLKT